MSRGTKYLLFVRLYLNYDVSEALTIQTASFGGLCSLGGSHVAGRRRYGCLDAEIGDKLWLTGSSIAKKHLRSVMKLDESFRVISSGDWQRCWGLS